MMGGRGWNNLSSLIYGSRAPFDGVSEKSSTERHLIFISFIHSGHSPFLLRSYRGSGRCWMTPLWPFSVCDKPEGRLGAFGVKGRLKGGREGGGGRLAHPLGPLFPVPRLAVPATSFQWVCVLAGAQALQGPIMRSLVTMLYVISVCPLITQL